MKKHRSQKSLERLLYQLYSEVLDIFQQKPPEIYTMNTHEYKKGVVNTYPEFFLKPSYYEIKDKIFKINSFKEIVAFIKERPDILESDLETSEGKKMFEAVGIEESFGLQVYNVVESLIEKYNRPKFTISWNFTPIQTLNIEESMLIKLFNKKYKENYIYYYFLENFSMESDEINFSINNQKLSLKKLSDEEKKLILNAADSKHSTANIKNNIYNINVALTSKKKIEATLQEKLLFLFRVFQKGIFRYSSIGHFSKNKIFKTPIFSCLFDQGSFAEPNYIYNWSVPKKSDYLIKESDEHKLIEFIENNFDKITEKFDFSIDIFAKLHSFGDKYATRGRKYQIPLLVMGLESFFNISEKITFTISLLVAKLLKDNSLFAIMKIIYAIRSDIVHGNNKKLIKDIERLKVKREDLKDLTAIADFLEDILRKMTKVFIERQLHIDSKFDQEVCKMFLKTPKQHLPY